MNKKIRVFIFILLLAHCFSVSAQAAGLPTFDAVNAALNEIRNQLMQVQFIKDYALALERLEQLKATYLELLRFHSGLDDFIEVFVGDPLKEIMGFGRTRVRDAFLDFGWITPKIEILNEAPEPREMRGALEEITGSIPTSQTRPYIPFEEMQVVEGFQFAREVREAGESTRNAAKQISLEAKTASPKGAARLGVEAMAKMVLLSQQNQEALAKLIELQATQVEQTSREEKRYEQARIEYMEEFRQGIETLGRPE